MLTWREGRGGGEGGEEGEEEGKGEDEGEGRTKGEWKLQKFVPLRASMAAEASSRSDVSLLAAHCLPLMVLVSPNSSSSWMRNLHPFEIPLLIKG